jgi:hypothetical protein
MVDTAIAEEHHRWVFDERSDMGRVMADCRRFESESNCSLTIIGEKQEVIEAAAEHAASVHGHEDTPEMRKMMTEMLEPAEAYTAGERIKEPLPG